MTAMARISFYAPLNRQERDAVADWLEYTASILRGKMHPHVVTFDLDHLGRPGSQVPQWWKDEQQEKARAIGVDTPILRRLGETDEL